MKANLTVFLLLLLAASLSTRAEAAPDLPDHRGFSVNISGDLHGGITHEDNDSDTYYPLGLRLQASVEDGRDLELLARINTVKAFESKRVDDDNFLVDRFFLRQRNIIGKPLVFTAGRLPTTVNNGPGHFRMGLDRSDSELLAFTDLILDGVSLGYTFEQQNWRELLTIYAARQYDYGYEGGDENILEDSKIYGLNLTAESGSRAAFSFQAFVIKDIYNIPADVIIYDPLEIFPTFGNLTLDRTSLGDIYHTSMAYQDEGHGFNYFLALGWSHFDAKGVDKLGTGLLTSRGEGPEAKDGYGLYTGIRYDFADSRHSLGLEFNYGSENWIAFTAPDQFYLSKLTTRGYVGEIYTAYELPTEVFPTGLKRGLVRLGYQYLHYEYTGSGYWLGMPQEIDELNNDPLNAIFYIPTEYDQRLYLAADLYF
jgi:hypothetical protein